MDPKDKVKIEQVINFLIESQEYGDDWKEHIKVLEKVRDKIKTKKDE